VRLTFRPVQDSSGEQCNALNDPVTDRTSPERQLMFGGGPGVAFPAATQAVKREQISPAATQAVKREQISPAATQAVKREQVSPDLETPRKIRKIADNVSASQTMAVPVSPANQLEDHFKTPRKISKIADNGSASQVEHSQVQSSAIVEVSKVQSSAIVKVIKVHNKGGRPKTGPRRGRAAGAKSNKRMLGEASLRRDVTLQFKGAIINKILATGKKPSEIELSSRQAISKQSGFSWRNIVQWYAAKDSIFEQITKSKLGMYGPRPFGSNERLAGKSKPQCRIRGDTLNNEGYQTEVIKSLKDFLDLERSRGHTVSVIMLKDYYLKLLTRFAVKYKLMSAMEKCLDKSASLAQYSQLCLERHDKNADGIKSATRRKLSYSALSRIVLYCKLLCGGVGLITRSPGRQGQSTESHRKPHEAEVLRMQFLKISSGSQNPGVGCPRPQGFASHSKSSKTALAKPLLREVFDGFLYSALHVPETWLLNPPHRTVTYSTIQYETVHYNLTYA